MALVEESLPLPRDVYPLMKTMRDAFDEIMTILQQDETRVRRGYMLLQQQRDAMVHDIAAWHGQRPDIIVPEVDRQTTQRRDERERHVPSASVLSTENEHISLHDASSIVSSSAAVHSTPPLETYSRGNGAVTTAATRLARRATQPFASPQPHKKHSSASQSPPQRRSPPHTRLSRSAHTQEMDQSEVSSEALSEAWTSSHKSPQRRDSSLRYRNGHDDDYRDDDYDETGAYNLGWQTRPPKDDVTPTTASFQHRYYAPEPAAFHRVTERTRYTDALARLPADPLNRASPLASRSPVRPSTRSPSFWINVWPCFGTFSRTCRKPERVLVASHFRYMEDVTEVASKALHCQPAPLYLYEADGRLTRDVTGLQPEQHYLLFPSGGRYDDAFVPVALLELLVNDAKDALSRELSP